ncbi:MAG: putative Fe-S cluster assembly protein SufT [Candidatus Binatia bacterium]
MSREKPTLIKRDCAAIMIPSGEAITLAAGSSVWVTQSLGDTYTVMTDRGTMARIDGTDRDAIGVTRVAATTQVSSVADSREDIERQVWEQLKSCFDPEIPVNIVDLVLIYDCAVGPLTGGGYKAVVRFTLTAQGCGMGQFLKADIQKKLASVAGLQDVEVELVWDPPWNQSMISEAAKQQLGIS